MRENCKNFINATIIEKKSCNCKNAPIIKEPGVKCRIYNIVKDRTCNMCKQFEANK